jgi:hypothetical protein
MLYEQISAVTVPRGSRCRRQAGNSCGLLRTCLVLFLAGTIENYLCFLSECPIYFAMKHLVLRWCVMLPVTRVTGISHLTVTFDSRLDSPLPESEYQKCLTMEQGLQQRILNVQPAITRLTSSEYVSPILGTSLLGCLGSRFLQ